MGVPHGNPVACPVGRYLGIVVTPRIRCGIAIQRQRGSPGAAGVGRTRYKNVLIVVVRSAQAVTGVPHGNPVACPVGRYLGTDVIPRIRCGVAIQRQRVGPGAAGVGRA